MKNLKTEKLFISASLSGTVFFFLFFFSYLHTEVSRLWNKPVCSLFHVFNPQITIVMFGYYHNMTVPWVPTFASFLSPESVSSLLTQRYPPAIINKEYLFIRPPWWVNRAGYWHKFHNSIWFWFTSLQFDSIQYWLFWTSVTINGKFSQGN